MKMVLMDMDLWEFVENGDGRYSSSPLQYDGESEEMWKERMLKAGEAVNIICRALSKTQLP